MNATLRDWLLRGAVVALLAGAGYWFATATEWADVEVDLPARGEAAKNDLYATQLLLRRLGATVATPTDLAEMPPAQATLVLTSWHWDFLPGRAQRLQQWVEDGGHLVLYANTLNHEQLKRWLPVQTPAPPSKTASSPKGAKADTKDDDKDEDEASDDEAADKREPDSDDDTDGKAPTPAAQAASAVTRYLGPPCHESTEPPAVPAAYPDGGRHFKLCTYLYGNRKLQHRATPQWALEIDGTERLLRVAQGRGQVTVIQPWGLLDNDRVLKGDNGLVVVAALQARAGAHIWFVTEETRTPLLPWLWQEAWVVVVLSGLALVLALWRGSRRFGPLLASRPLGRRSMVEQITGTAQFLRRQGPEALLTAQVRALDSAARGHLRHYDKLDRGQRAAAIAKVTGQDATAMARALDTTGSRTRTDLPATLELLETARRLLVQRDRTPRR